MPWVNVEIFDRDVKLGDRIRSVGETSPNYDIVKYIGTDVFVVQGLSIDFASIKSKDWQVWRETKRWKPSAGVYYYYVSPYGQIHVCKFSDDENAGYLHNLHYKIGNCFPSTEMAQEYADECKKVAERLHERFKE